MTAAPKPYDFRQPQPEPPEIRRQLTLWLEALIERWQELGRQQLQFPWSLQLASLRRCYVASILGELPENLLVYPVQWSARAGSLLGISRPLALALTLAMLGETVASLPADRPLTEVEFALWEYVLDQRLLAGAKACWAREPSPLWQRGAREPAPQFSSVLRQQTIVFLADLSTAPPWADGHILWLLTESVIQEFFSARPSEPSAGISPQELLQGVPLQLVVQLGQTRLPLAQLHQLRSGDVLLLEQRLDEPLLVLLEDQPRYRAWPGRVGTQRAIQILADREE
jgi:flagellar motor switch protein FliM